MRIQRVAVAHMITNLAILGALLLGAGSSPRSEADVIRGRALEVVDAAGRVRASIRLQDPATVDGVAYPETVVFRLIRLTASPW